MSQTTENASSSPTAEVAAIPKGYWQDAKGNLIPVARIKDVDKERHALVTELAEEAKQLQEVLREFKLSLLAGIQQFLDDSAARYSAKLRGAAGKGNVQLVSFDGRYKVLRAVQDSIAFDERLQVAKSIIDERVHVWSKGANSNIKALVNHAFQVDAVGKVSVGRILGLKQIKIDDPEWLKAMQAINDSMQVASSKTYVRLYERDDATGEYRPISLDIAAL